jgi:uncharacterized lipoprotein
LRLRRSGATISLDPEKKIVTKRCFGIALCVAAVSLSGCALTTEKIELQYKQQQGFTQIPGASGVSVNVKVTDLRQDKSKVSVKKNGYGMEMAPIIATDDVAATLRKAIEDELRARGFQFDADGALVRIAADLTRFYSDFKIGFFAGDAVADLNMAVTVVSKKGDSLYSRQIMVQGTEPNIQLASGENAKAALDKALANGVRVLVEDRAFLSALMSTSPRTAAARKR